MVPPADLDSLSHAELKNLVVALLEQAAELQRMNAALRDEIARLKGGSGRPNIKPNANPSGMEKATEPKPDKPGGPGGEKRRRGATKAKLSINEERTIKVAAPPGSRFKGYTSFIVQDLVIQRHVVNFRCERWLTPDGTMLTAPLPAGITGHFGPQLRRFILAQYHQGQVTVPRLVGQLRGFGIIISKRQVVRLLNEGQDPFLNEANEALHAGLSSAAWITVDDTGARHKGPERLLHPNRQRAFCLVWHHRLKEPQQFPHAAGAGHDDYIINAEALAYMRQRKLAAYVISRLAEHPDRCFADEAAFLAHLDRLGITALTVDPDPVKIATEGALWGSIKAHGLLPDTVIVSDDAGQFNVGRHGLCWVQYLESDLILSVETEGPTCRGISPKRLKIKNRKSKSDCRNAKRSGLVFNGLAGSDSIPACLQGLKGDALHLQVCHHPGWSSPRGRDSRELPPSRSRAAGVPRTHRRSPIRRLSAEARNLSGVQANPKPQSIGVGREYPR